MPQNRQYYRKVKYPDKVAKPKCRVFVRIFLFCSVGIKIQYFPTVPFYILLISACIIFPTNEAKLSSDFTFTKLRPKIF